MSNDQHNRVYWIGGSSCSGKSSAAKRIADRFGLSLYRTDEHAFGKYMFDICEEERYPNTIHYRNLLLGGMDAFFRRSPAELLESFLRYCREVFPQLLHDVQSIAQEQPVLVEGAHVLPEFFVGNGNREHSIFLISTKEQQARIWLLEMEGKIPGGHPGEIENYHRASDKQRIEQWRTTFHHNIARYIERTAVENQLRVFVVDQQTSEATVERAILEQLRLHKNE